MISEVKNFFQFIKENVVLTFFTITFTLIVYGIKLSNSAFGMDTNFYISDYSGYLRHWISIGRFGQVLLKKILWGPYTNIYLVNILSVLLFALSSLLLCYLFSKIVSNRKITYQMFIIPSLFLTSPIFVYQYYFVLQNFEFSLGIVLVVLSIILMTIKLQNKWTRYLYGGISVLMVTLAISVYQSFILFFIAVSAAVLLLDLYNRYLNDEPYPFAKLIKTALPYIGILIISVVLYFSLDKAVYMVTKIPRQGHSVDMMVWQNVSLKEGIISLAKAIKSIVFFPLQGNQFYNYSILTGIVLLLPVIVQFFLKRKKNRLSILICFAVIVCAGFGIVLATGTSPVPRSMAPQFPFLASFLLFYASLFYTNKLLKGIVIIVISLLTFSQVKTTSNLLFSEQMTFEEDQRKMVEIDQAIKNLELEDPSSYKLVILGESVATNKFNLIGFNELVGVSMLQFGWSQDLGSYYINANIISIMKIMGMEYQAPTIDEYLEYWQNRSTIKDSSTSLGIEVIDHFIIVKVN